MIRLKQVVLCEGKYDKIRLSNIIDAHIITTDGFRIFKDKEKLAFLRAAAERCGLLIITDSDSAGQLIRTRLRGYIDPQYINNVYLPPIKGKERRKAAPSAEGFLGVEGTDDEIIRRALEAYAAGEEKIEAITKADFYALGLSGEGSEARRDRIKTRFALPKAMSAKALLDALNILITRDELIKEVEEWDKK